MLIRNASVWAVPQNPPQQCRYQPKYERLVTEKKRRLNYLPLSSNQEPGKARSPAEKSKGGMIGVCLSVSA
jgi:hypothetical protein